MNLTKLVAKLKRRTDSLRKNRLRSRKQRNKFKRTHRRGNLRAAKRYGRAAQRDAKAIRKLKRLIKETNRPSKNFSYSEFDCHNGDTVPTESYAALDHLCEHFLEPLRAKFGAVGVTSGYRPRGYNASIGGATNSVHIYDFPDGRNYRCVAADVHCANGSVEQWASFIRERNPGGLGIYPSSGFIHVDNRDLAGWSRAEWRG